MLNPLDYLFDRAFEVLPKPAQWTLIVSAAILLLALLAYFLSQGRLS